MPITQSRRFGSFRLDAQESTLWCGDEPLGVTHKARKVALGLRDPAAVTMHLRQRFGPSARLRETLQCGPGAAA